MPRLLILTYYWPPCGGPGSLRPVKFAKYLPKFGIEPIILTRKDIAYHSLDNELLNEVKNLKTIKTESFDPARPLFILGMRKYQPRRWQIPIKRALNFPDNKTGWIPFAYDAGMKLSFDYIFVTAPPFSCFISGYLLAKRTGKPLILDFRDAWLEFPFFRYKTKAEKEFVSYWEEKLTKSASMITVVDENIRNSLAKKYPKLVDKIFVIPNGYDPKDFTPAKKPEILTIAYLGTIRKERDPTNFLEAVRELIIEKEIPKDGIRMKFIGHIEDYYLKQIKNLPFVEISGHLSYRQAIREFIASHVALLITTGDEYFFPSRQNEYLASGLPIIVCGQSKGIHLIEQAFERGYPGWVFDYDDIYGMKEKIYELHFKFRWEELPTGETPYKEHTRENLTKMFVELINKIIP